SAQDQVEWPLLDRRLADSRRRLQDGRVANVRLVLQIHIRYSRRIRHCAVMGDNIGETVDPNVVAEFCMYSGRCFDRHDPAFVSYEPSGKDGEVSNVCTDVDKDVAPRHSFLDQLSEAWL